MQQDSDDREETDEAEASAGREGGSREIAPPERLLWTRKRRNEDKEVLRDWRCFYTTQGDWRWQALDQEEWQ